MLSELLQAALVDVVNHAGGASRDLPALLQTLCFALAIRQIFAVHEIIVVRFAACADEEGCREQRCRRGSNLWDLGDAVRKGSGVDEDLLVEAVVLLAWCS